jgi:hypothetical protein
VFVAGGSASVDPNLWTNKSRMLSGSVYYAEPTIASGDDLHLITVNDPKIAN